MDINFDDPKKREPPILSKEDMKENVTSTKIKICFSLDDDDESNDPEVDTDDVNEDFVKLKSKRLKRLKGTTRSTGLKPAYYTCTFCDKDFKTKKYLHVHVEVEHHGLRYKCVQHCGRLFKSVTNRNAHNCSGIKEEMNPDLFQCQHCDKSYYMKKYLDKFAKLTWKIPLIANDSIGPYFISDFCYFCKTLDFSFNTVAV